MLLYAPNPCHRFDDRRDDNALRRSRDVIPSSRDANSARDRDDRRFDDRRTSGSSDRGFERYNLFTLTC